MSATERPRFARNKFLREERAQKRVQAQTRQSEYDKLTPQQKLAKLDRGGFTATKEREKLAKILEAKPQDPPRQFASKSEERRYKRGMGIKE